MMTINIPPYKAHGPMKSGHVNTLFRHFFSNNIVHPFKREALLLDEGFHLHLDWFCQNQSPNKKLLLFTHGLESSSFSPDIQQTIPQAQKLGFDVLAYNCRNCAQGEPLEAGAFYHSGLSSDLAQVVNHVIKNQHYQSIVLVGLSMGGNITLKYLGEQGANVPKALKAALVVSAPLHLSDCSKQLLRFPDSIYAQHFLRSLKQKVKALKTGIAEQGIDVNSVLNCKNLNQFDDRLVAKIHGFKNAEDYYQQSSSINLLGSIALPTVLINAQNDPILSQSCYPDIANPNIQSYYPKHGGHLGFYLKRGHYLSRCIQALKNSAFIKSA